MNGKIPVTVVSGFLGAGKTTLIADLVRQCVDTRFALVVNEFGPVSIDGAILFGVAPNASVFNITETLIGYNEDDAFIPDLQKIAGRGVDRVIIETSGLAVPTGIVERLSSESLKAKFHLDSIMTVIDAPWLLDTAMTPAIAEVFRLQVSAADIVVLNKIDGLTHHQLLTAEAVLRSAAPSVRFIEPAYKAHLESSLVLGVHLHEPRHHIHLPAAARTGEITDGHSHGGMNAHDHGLLTHEHLHEHDPGWLSFVLHSHYPQSVDLIDKTIKHIAQTQPLLRAKGFVATSTDEQIEVQCVRDRLELGKDHHWHQHHHEHHHEHEHDHELEREQHHQHNHLSELVFIGYNLDRAAVAGEMSALTGTHWS